MTKPRVLLALAATAVILTGCSGVGSTDTTTLESAPAAQPAVQQAATYLRDADIPEWDVQKMLDAQEQNLPRNCRLTVFEVGRSFITVDKTEGADPTMLFADHEQLESYLPEDVAVFDTLFGRIPTTSDPAAEPRAKDIDAYLAQHGVHYTNPAVHVINVYLHDTLDPQAYSFVGHTAIAVERADGIELIEKLSFDDPYQVTHYSTLDAAVAVLYHRYDFSGVEGDPSGPPLVYVDTTWHPVQPGAGAAPAPAGAAPVEGPAGGTALEVPAGTPEVVPAPLPAPDAEPASVH